MSQGGIIDKLMGDPVLMFFEKPSKALIAALAMFKRVEGRNREAERMEVEPIYLSIGINTGDVCLGTVGTQNRMETTTIGDAVNVASRVASLTKMYKSPLLFTKSTQAHLKKLQLKSRNLGLAQVKGRPHPVTVFELLDVQSPEQQVKKLATAKLMEEALEAFNQDKLEVADPLICQILEQNPEDGPAQFLKRWIDEGPVEFVK
jgi:two-component system sensor histidine kinase ChiS